MSFFNPNKFFPINLIIKPIGVTTKKKTIPITIGEIKFPRKIPNLNHILFKGVNICEFIDPNKRKITEIINVHILNSPPLISGQKDSIKKNTKKTKPKFLFDEILILFVLFN